jgi:hypothetical protein
MPVSHRLPPSVPSPLVPGAVVVALVEVRGTAGKLAHPRGAVGVVVSVPTADAETYRVRFPDGFEAPLARGELVLLAHYKQGVMDQAFEVHAACNLYDHLILRVIVGSRAFGLDDGDSDTDRRGIYLAPAELHWSLYGVPEQIENEQEQEQYWELQKFLAMALKANPNVLECLYSPLIETATPPAQELLAMRECFLSKLVYQTYNGYVMSQFKKIAAEVRNRGRVKWKHVMHLLRLLHSGITVLREGYVPVRVEAERERLLAVRRGEVPWDEVEAWRLWLHEDFDRAFSGTRLPDRPDYERANAFLLKARREAAGL